MSKFYAGLDVADLTTAVCVIDDAGRIILETSVETSPKAIEQSLKPYRRMLVAVAQESGPKAQWLHKELSRKHIPAVCMDARAASKILETQRNKTDRNDARGIANIVRTGWYTSAYVKSDDALRTRLLLTHRRALKSNAIRLEMSLRISVKTFGASVTKRAGNLKVIWDKRRSDALLERLAEMMIRSRSALLKEVNVLDAIVAKIAKSDPVCRRLMTVPGVGPLTAVTFRAAIDDPHRFASSRTVGAAFGLTPRRNQSGTIDYSGRISRRGDESARSALYQAAFVMLFNSNSKCALRAWGLQMRKRKGNGHATVAVARKMAVVLHRMWVTGRDFDPSPSSA